MRKGGLDVRLDKLLAGAGLSRSQARRAVAAGRVRVRGELARDAGLHAESADVLFDGQPLASPGEVYVMLHKPAGVLSAVRDAREKTAFDLLDAAVRAKNPSPVGRLDRDVTGLLLFTSDGELLHRLISPRYEVEKVYQARVEGTPDADDARALAQGVRLSDFVARPARLEVVSPGLIRLCVTEGKYHQVKRMLAAVGHPVTALKRLSVGGVALDEALLPGQSRPLSGAEISALRRLVRLED